MSEMTTAEEQDEVLNALIYTVEYVGADLLPAKEGWDWFDVLKKYRPEHPLVTGISPLLPVVDDVPTCVPEGEQR